MFKNMSLLAFWRIMKTIHFRKPHREISPKMRVSGLFEANMAAILDFGKKTATFQCYWLDYLEALFQWLSLHFQVQGFSAQLRWPSRPFFCCWCFIPLVLSFFFRRIISVVTWPIATQILPHVASLSLRRCRYLMPLFSARQCRARYMLSPIPLSVTVDQSKTVEVRIMQLSQQSSPIRLVFTAYFNPEIPTG